MVADKIIWKIGLIWAALMMAAAAMAAPETNANGALDFAIDPAPLARAVRMFAQRAGISISYQPATVRGKQSQGLSGRYSVAAGLARLLEGTSIAVQAQPNGDYILRLAGEDEAEAGGVVAPAGLPQVRVEGTGASPVLPMASAALKLTATENETPRTLAIIPAEVIRQTNATSLVEALRTVPGIAFRGADALTAPAGDRPFIRGFDAANSVLVDGLRSAGPQGRELFSVEQVEVIEGPASVVSARGAGGGNINLVSKVPGQDNAAAVATSVGTAGLVRQTVDINRAINDDVAARLNLMWQDADKAGRSMVASRRWGVAPVITFGMHSPTRLTLSYYHLASQEVPDYSVPYTRGGGAPLEAGGSTFYGLLARDKLRASTDIAQADFRQTLASGAVLRNLTQYSRVSQSFIATNPQWAGSSGDVLSLQAKSGVFDVRSLVNQTEVSGTWGHHDWVAGLELGHEHGQRDALDVRDQAGNSLANGASCAVPFNCTSLSGWDPGAPWSGTVGDPTGQMSMRVVTDTASAYWADTLRLDPKWLLNAGVRYDYFRTRADGTDRLGAVQGSWNYQVGLVHKPVEQVNVYASLSTSTNPVGADAGTGSDSISTSTRDLSPERVRNIEVGIKLDNADQTLSATVSAFRSVKRNARISASRDTIAGATQSIRGIEASLRGNLTPAWKIFGGVSLLGSIIDDGGTAPAVSGNAFPMVPRRSAALWSSYQLTPAVSAGIGATYSARVYANVANTNFVPAYTRLDAMLACDIDPLVTLQLNVYNLADKRYYDVAYPVYASIAPARSAVLTMRIKY